LDLAVSPKLNKYLKLSKKYQEKMFTKIEHFKPKEDLSDFCMKEVLITNK